MKGHFLLNVKDANAWVWITRTWTEGHAALEDTWLPNLLRIEGRERRIYRCLFDGERMRDETEITVEVSRKKFINATLDLWEQGKFRS